MTTRLKALDVARKYIGVMEHPSGSNRGAIIDRWNRDACGLVAVYWCASAVHGWFKEAGLTLPGGASVANISAWAHSVGDVVQRPFKGDLVLYSWNEPYQHIGILERVLSIRLWKSQGLIFIQTIEGNTSSGVSGSQDNGGGVFRRKRLIKRSQVEFVRVYDKGEKR